MIPCETRPSRLTSRHVARCAVGGPPLWPRSHARRWASRTKHPAAARSSPRPAARQPPSRGGSPSAPCSPHKPACQRPPQGPVQPLPQQGVEELHGIQVHPGTAAVRRRLPLRLEGGRHRLAPSLRNTSFTQWTVTVPSFRCNKISSSVCPTMQKQMPLTSQVSLLAITPAIFQKGAASSSPAARLPPPPSAWRPARPLHGAPAQRRLLARSWPTCNLGTCKHHGSPNRGARWHLLPR